MRFHEVVCLKSSYLFFYKIEDLLTIPHQKRAEAYTR